MAVYPASGMKQVSKTHTINEFISLGKTSTDSTSYRDISYFETRDNIEFVVKNLLDDYLYELKQLAIQIQLTDKEIETYRFNPKLLSYKLYGSTKIYYVLLKINDMCNIHEFSLSNKKLLLLTPKDMSSSLSSIYNSEKFSLSKFINSHKEDKIITPINKFR